MMLITFPSEHVVAAILSQKGHTLMYLSMLYQMYGCKERTKYRVANQTRRQVKKNNNYINKQETKGSNNCVGE